jgi:hypothetical protein
MASIGDAFKSDLGKGVLIGLGAVALAPVVLPAVAGVARPFAKAVIKGGLVVYEKGRETAAELGEAVDDPVAEARAELEQGWSPNPQAGQAPSGQAKGTATPSEQSGQGTAHPRRPA